MLVRRTITTTFVLGEGNFGTDGQNQVSLSGLRVVATVANAGGRSMGKLDASIYGMTLSQMNKLSSLGQVVSMVRKNSITLGAGDEGKPPSTVFQGTIINAWGEFGAQPDVPFRVSAQTGLLDAVIPATTPISISGSADVATMLSGLASQMGLAFENNGVDVKLTTPYYGGSPRGQALAIVKDAGIEWNGGEKGVLAIWKPGESRGGTVPVISAASGMIGYPTFTANGLSVQMVFNPTIGLGSKFKIESILTPANREWVVYKIDHQLESMQPRGRWSTTVLAAPPGFGPFVA